MSAILTSLPEAKRHAERTAREGGPLLPHLAQARADDAADQGEHEEVEHRGLGQPDQARARQDGEVAGDEGRHHAG